MYVCICNGITDKQIRAAVARGVGSLEELQEELGVASQCGSCAEHALTMLSDPGPRAVVDEGLYYSAA